MTFASPSAYAAAPDDVHGRVAAVARALTLVSIVLIFTLSPAALDWMGLDYLGTGGNPLVKVHPGTLVAMLAVLAWSAALGPSAFFGRLLAYPGFLALTGGLVFLIVYDVASVGQPVTPLVETYGLSLCLFVALVVDPTAPQPGLQRLLHLLFAANAVIGLVEFLFGVRLFPYSFGNGVPVPEDWRSTALFGHPLSNAMLIATYVVALLVGAQGLGRRARLGMIMLQTAGLIVFGGRTGLILALVAICIAVMFSGLRVLRGSRMRLLDLIVVVAAFPVLALVVAVLAERGFFDLLLERFVSDDGSAQTRVIMFHLLGQLPLVNLLFGTDRGLITTLVDMEGLEYGIESFEVAMTIRFGIVPCFIFFAALVAFVVDIVRATRLLALLPLGCFFLIASSSLSIAEKAPELGMAVSMVLITMRNRPIAAAG